MMRLFIPLALALLTACGGEEAATTTAPAPAPEPAAEPAPEPEVASAEPAAFDAAGAFASTCASCHGEAGAGDGVAGAALDPKPANFTDAAFHAERDDAQIAKVIKEGGAAVGKSPLMAPFGGSFDDAQIEQLVAHVRTFNPDAEPLATPPEGMPEGKGMPATGGDAPGGDAPAADAPAGDGGGGAPAGGAEKGSKGGKGKAKGGE